MSLEWLPLVTSNIIKRSRNYCPIICLELSDDDDDDKYGDVVVVIDDDDDDDDDGSGGVDDDVFYRISVISANNHRTAIRRIQTVTTPLRGYHYYYRHHVHRHHVHRHRMHRHRRHYLSCRRFLEAVIMVAINFLNCPLTMMLVQYHQQQQQQRR